MAHDNDHYSVFLVIAGIVNGTQPVISEELATSLAVFSMLEMEKRVSDI